LHGQDLEAFVEDPLKHVALLPLLQNIRLDDGESALGHFSSFLGLLMAHSSPQAKKSGKFAPERCGIGEKSGPVPLHCARLCGSIRGPFTSFWTEAEGPCSSPSFRSR